MRHAFRVTIAVESPSQMRIPKRLITSLVRYILRHELGDCSHPLEVSIVFCDDERIAQLNAQYLDRNCATDVLSFPQLSPPIKESLEELGVMDASEPIPLGDVVISVQTAARQAKRYKHSVEDELVRLTAHGILHLLGYDDATVHGRRKMAQRERMLIRSWRRERMRA